LDSLLHSYSLPPTFLKAETPWILTPLGGLLEDKEETPLKEEVEGDSLVEEDTLEDSLEEDFQEEEDPLEEVALIEEVEEEDSLEEDPLEEGSLEDHQEEDILEDPLEEELQEVEDNLLHNNLVCLILQELSGSPLLILIQN
jgi:hypothetical protein